LGAIRPAFQDFYRSTTELAGALNRIGDNDPVSVLRARRALIECRLHYKRIEYFLEYFFRGPAVIYNHPAKYEVEEPHMEFEEPRGLQVIEALLFEKKVFVVKDKLLQQATVVNESARDLGALLYDFAMDDGQLLESLRIELIRVMTLDISGYDAPHLKSGIAEAYEALHSMQVALQPYMTARGSDSVGFYLNAALDRLRENRDFDRFDRMGFLTEAALPLQHSLGLLIKRLGREIHTVPALNYAAENLFARDAFDQRAFPNGRCAGDSLVKLGRRLFFEKALSGNYSRSCATCHRPGQYFTDGVAKSIAYDNISTVKRNAPSLLYAGFQYYQFWDGRAKALEEQVIDVLTNPSEMHADTAMVGQRMEPLSVSRVAMALAAYIRTLSPMNSPFDRYMAGDKQAMTASQVRGFNLFMGKAQCGTCHFAPLFNGLTPPLFATTEFEVLGVPVTDDLARPRGDSDSGRYAVFPIPYYLQAFKTPTVRNSAVTAPYMHNGSFHTLKKVIEFYNKGGGEGLGLVTPEQTLAPEPLGLSAKEIREIEEFLRALTDSMADGDAQ
jgi:cytochrome c peroxidase